MTRSKKPNKPSKRKPLSDRARLTRDSILQAAAHIALREGLEAINTNRIAEKAGISIGSLYQYFPDKTSILGDMVELAIQKRQARLRESLELGDLSLPLRELVRKFLDAAFDFESDQERKMDALLVPLLAQTNRIESIFKLMERGERFLNPALKTLILLKNPKMMARDLDSTLFVLVQSIRGVILACSLERSEEKRERIKTELTNWIVAALGPPLRE